MKATSGRPAETGDVHRYIKDSQTYLLTSLAEHQIAGVHSLVAADCCLASSAQVSLGLAAPDPTDHNG